MSRLGHLTRADRIAFRKAIKPYFGGAVSTGKCPPHRLRPLLDENRNLVGHACRNKGCTQVFTVTGQVSQPEERSTNGLHTRPTKVHGKRVKAARSRLKNAKTKGGKK